MRYLFIVKDELMILMDSLLLDFFFLERNLDDLDIALRSLPAPEVRSLAKTLHIPSQSQTREQLIEAVTKHSQKTGIGAFFSGGSNAKKPRTSGVILKR